MKRIRLLLIPVVLLAAAACLSPAIHAQTISDPPAHALATDSAVYIFVNTLPADGVAGFVVYRADAPIDALNRERDHAANQSSTDLKSGIDSAHQDILDQLLAGKSLDDLQKEVEELEKTDPAAADKRKQEIQTAVEQYIKDFDDKSGKLQSDSKDAMDKYHEDYKNKVEAALKTGPAAADFTKLSDAPIKPMSGDSQILAALGPDAEQSLKSLGVDSASQLVTDYAKHKDKVDFLLLHSLAMNRVMGHVYEDTAVKSGQGYIYRVDLVDAKGNVIKSLDPVNATPRANPPDAPTGFKAEAMADHVEISWDKPDTAPNGWLVLRAGAPAGDFKQINPGVTSSLGKPMFKDWSVKPGQTLSYQLVAVDLVGNQSKPSETVTVTFTDTVAPTPPTGVQAALDNGRITLSWPTGADTDTDLAGYNVYFSDAMDGQYKLLTSTPLAANATQYTTDVAVAGAVHYYRITALDAAGNESAQSHVAWVQPKDTQGPGAITGLSGKHSGPDAVTLTWNPVAAPDLHGYHVYRGYTKNDMKKIHTAVIPHETQTYEDDNLHPGQTYYYAVAGVDIHMNEGAMSDVIEIAAPDAVAPAHPANIAARGGDASITLSWPANHEPDVAAYRLYRADTENGAFSKITDTDASATQYVDKTGLGNGAEYWYYMTAVDTAGNESDPSHKAYATPRDTTAPAAPQGASATPAGTGITVSWTPCADTDISGYTVLRAPAETAVYQTVSETPVAAGPFTDSSATPGLAYWYKIVAVDTSGNTSPRSSAAGPATLEAGK